MTRVWEISLAQSVQRLGCGLEGPVFECWQMREVIFPRRVQTCSRPAQQFISGYLGSFPGVKRQGHSYVASSLRRSGVIPICPICFHGADRDKSALYFHKQYQHVHTVTTQNKYITIITLNQYVSTHSVSCSGRTIRICISINVLLPEDDPELVETCLRFNVTTVMC